MTTTNPEGNEEIESFTRQLHVKCKILLLYTKRTDVVEQQDEPQAYVQDSLRSAPAQSFQEHVLQVSFTHSGRLKDPHEGCISDISNCETFIDSFPVGLLYFLGSKFSLLKTLFKCCIFNTFFLFFYQHLICFSISLYFPKLYLLFSLSPCICLLGIFLVFITF